MHGYDILVRTNVSVELGRAGAAQSLGCRHGVRDRIS